jgi:hypothetical protein
MRVSEGVPDGNIVELYNPEQFKEREEVIVFTREDFHNTYNSISGQIEYINKIAMHLDVGDDWKLLGYWPKFLERIYLLDLNMDLIFQEEPVQCYLDTYLYNSIGSSEKAVAVSKSKVPVQLKFSI